MEIPFHISFLALMKLFHVNSITVHIEPVRDFDNEPPIGMIRVTNGVERLYYSLSHQRIMTVLRPSPRWESLLDEFKSHLEKEIKEDDEDPNRPIAEFIT